MDYYQLHCFRIAAKHQSITKAAKELFISQPSLTQTIRRLEDDLGYPLFDRSHKKIELNASGKLLFERVCQIEQLMEDTRTELDDFNQISKPTVNLYIGCASMLLPRLLLFLKDTYPRIDFRLFQWNYDKQEENHGLWLVTEPRSSKDLLLLEESFSLAVPNSNPLSEKSRIVLHDLHDQSFLQLTEQWSITKLISKEFKRKGFYPHITMQFDNPVLMREVLLCRMGLAFIPSVSWKLPENCDLTMRTVDGLNLKRTIYLHVPDGCQTLEQKICIEGIQKFFRTL
ncbi:MAG: LysR family transcriptional regulator [Eubacteriales bacterium]|nr:LysR family transcriptional regulator [Eubacteriales bacterium]